MNGKCVVFWFGGQHRSWFRFTGGRIAGEASIGQHTYVMYGFVRDTINFWPVKP